MNGIPLNRVLSACGEIRLAVMTMKNKTLPKLIELLLASAVLCLLIASAQAATPKKLLVVTVTKEFRHSSIPTAEKVLADVGKTSGAFTVDYARNEQEIAEKMTPDALKQYDGVIFANTTGDLPLPDKQAFIDWVKSGKADRKST